MNQMNPMAGVLNSLPDVETTNGTRSIISNGTVKSDNEGKSTRRRASERIRAKTQSSQEPSSSTTSTRRLREVDSERDKEVQNLKRKLDETEEYLGNSNKRRAIWAGIGAFVGVGIAVVLMSMGIGVSDIATGIYDFGNKLGGMFGY